MTINHELLPCPFCGGAAKRITLEDADNFGGDVITCSQCDCCTRVVFGEKEGLVESWNRRAKAAPEAEPVAAVAYLDVGAGGYVDLGTDQPIEALEKMPYGRHVLGIIGTYGADGWNPSPSQPANKSEPVGYAAFSDNGKIRVWSLEPGVIEMMAAQGCKAVPLYTAPQHDADHAEHPRAMVDAELVELLTLAVDRLECAESGFHGSVPFLDRLCAKLAALASSKERNGG